MISSLILKSMYLIIGRELMSIDHLVTASVSTFVRPFYRLVRCALIAPLSFWYYKQKSKNKYMSIHKQKCIDKYVLLCYNSNHKQEILGAICDLSQVSYNKTTDGWTDRVICRGRFTLTKCLPFKLSSLEKITKYVLCLFFGFYVKDY